MPGPLFIETDRLELRTPEEEDQEFLQALNNHPKIRRYIDSLRTPTTADEYEEFYDANVAGDGSVVLLVCADGERVGTVSLAPVNDERGWANLGATIHPDDWGNGYATEACAHLLEYGFADLRLHRVSAVVDAGNDASIALVERLGFVHEGTSRDDIYRDGGYVDRERYGLLERDWPGVDPVLDGR